MRNVMLVVALVAACGQPEPSAPRPRTERGSAVLALQEGKFDDALKQSAAWLAQDPHSSRAAAVHAIAHYQQAASTVWVELEGVINGAGSLKFFDHEKGRAAWKTFLADLDAIDRDLAIAANDPNFALELCLACWKYDWNHSGTIDERDLKMLDVEFDGKGGDLAENDPRRKPTYRFDRGDALWARAMLSFQRAGVELVLAYRWSELDKLFSGRDDKLHMTIKLVDPGRVKRAHALILAGVGFSEQTREAYLAETDDDREWVPNPRQKSYAMPLEVDTKLYDTWAAVLGDVRRMLDSQEGVSLREVAGMILGPRHVSEIPNAYVDIGRMLREPQDIVFDINDDLTPPQMLERIFRGVLGRGYAEAMRASPLVGRLRHMKEELERGEDTFDRKLRYLFWLN